MKVHKGMHVRELSKRVGGSARTGVVLEVAGRTVTVQWDDGHRSSLSGGLLVPVEGSRR